MPTNMPRLAELPPSAWAVVAALLALTAMLLLRRVWARLLGPVFVWDTERLARRRTTFVLRVVIVTALFAALYSAWPTVREVAASPAGQHVGLEVAHRFSRDFSEAFLFAQAAVLLFLTPLYLGGVITDEKEKRTLDFLLVTQLRDRDIILGKFGSRMLALLMAELSALPVLAATLLVGGVELPRLFAGVAVTGLTVLSVGSFALLCSVLARRTWVAVAGCYAAIGLVAGLSLALSFGHLVSPMAFYRRLETVLQRARTEADVVPMILRQLDGYAGLHLGLMAVFLLLAWLLFRRLAQRGLAGALARPVRRQTLAEKPRPIRVYRSRARIPPVGDSPIIWKERYLGRTVVGRTLQLVATLSFAAAAVLLIGLAVDLESMNTFAIYTQVLAALRGLFVMAGVFLILAVGLRLCGAVSREREQRTLESLLTLPNARRRILYAKWIGAWLRARHYAAGLIFAAGLVAIQERDGQLGCALAVLTAAIHPLFAANLGLYLSMVCQSTIRAHVTLAVILVTFLAGSWAVAALLQPPTMPSPPRPNPVYVVGTYPKMAPAPGMNLEAPDTMVLSDRDQLYVWAVGLNPVLTWWRLLGAHSLQEHDLYALVIGMVVYLAAAGLLWYLANDRFRREAVLG
ncbi:MAG: ABC transporter permease [Gemmataceae bacterium]